MPSKNKPGCNCCGPSCTIKEDTFTRANGSIGGDWTAPDWDISSNAAVTNDDNAPAISATTWTDSNGVITATFTGDDYSDEAELRISWEDANNYLFALFTLAASAGACGTIKLFKREGGTNTQLGDTRTINGFEPDTTHVIGLCRNGDRITGYRDLSGIITSVADDGAPSTITGVQAGFASGSITSQITIDDFLWTTYSEECRECGAPCEFFIDDFDRSNNTDLGCDWTEDAGAAEINTNLLRVTSSNSVIATTVETPNGNQLAKAIVRGGNNGDQGRVLVRITDTSNYLFGEVQFGATNSTLNLYRRNAGSNTLLATASLLLLATGDPCELKVCYYGTTLTVQAYENTILKGTLSAVVSSPPSGLRTGVGSGSITSAVTFDEFRMLRHNDAGRTECDECAPQCSCCDVSYQPFRQYVVDLGAGGLSDSACSACDDIAGEYVLDPVTGQTCTFRYQDCTWCSFTNNAVPTCVNTNHGFAVTLQHVCSGFPTLTSAIWRVTVSITNQGTTCGQDPSCAFSRTAVYESSNLISSATRCQDMPVTLTKISDAFAAVHGGSGQQVCTGSLPGTITVRLP